MMIIFLRIIGDKKAAFTRAPGSRRYKTNGKAGSTCRQALRQAQGESLVSLLIATLLMGFVAAGICGLAYLNNTTNIRLSNKSDALNAARLAMERIGSTVRMGRNVGDYYGNLAPEVEPTIDITNLGVGPTTNTNVVAPDNPTLASVLNATIADYGSATFPSPGDPFYMTRTGTPATPPNGWPGEPGWEFTTVNSKSGYHLSPDTLIVQVPAFDAKGFPVTLQGVTANIQCMDTYVYKVVPDGNDIDGRPTWRLQVAGFPAMVNGLPVGTSMNIGSQPITILRGIIGPVDPNDNTQIRVFEYVDKNSGQTISDPPDGSIPDISGVVINIEIKRIEAGSNIGPKEKAKYQEGIMAFKSEFYMRNNSQMQTIGQPP